MSKQQYFQSQKSYPSAQPEHALPCLPKVLGCLSVALSLGAAQQANAATYENAMKNAGYVVMTGDVNGDGHNDVLFKAKSKLLLIPLDEIDIPVLLPSASPSFALVSVAFGKYTLVVKPDAATLASAAWAPATQQITYTGAGGTHTDTVTIGPVADHQAGFKIGITDTGTLELISTTAPLVDPTAPPSVSPVYAMSDFMRGAQDFTLCTKSQNGDRLLVWTTADAARDAMLKRWDAAGKVLGPEENVNLGKSLVSLSANRVGNFMTLRRVPDGLYTSLQGAVYRRNGDTILNERQLHAMSPKLYYPEGHVVLYEDGSSGFAYQTSGPQDPHKLWFNRFEANGTPINQFSHDIGINTVLNAIVSNQAVVGRTVMSYMGPVQDSNGAWEWAGKHVYSQWPNDIFSQASSVGKRYEEHLSMSPNGRYAATWSVYDSGAKGYRVYSQAYDSTGNYGAVTTISTSLLAESPSPKAAMFDNNSYAVTWYENVGGVRSLKTRLVDGWFGKIFGNEKVVTTGLRRTVPFGVCSDASGSYSVAWRNETEVNGIVATDVLLRDYAAESMPPIRPLQNGQQVLNLAADKGAWKYYKITVPTGMSSLDIAIASQTTSTVGNADLYIRYAGVPTKENYHSRLAGINNEEAGRVVSPPAGAYYIGIFATEAYQSTSLTVNYQ